MLRDLESLIKERSVPEMVAQLVSDGQENDASELVQQARPHLAT
jgi:hypothetical protein